MLYETGKSENAHAKSAAICSQKRIMKIIQDLSKLDGFV